MTVIIFFYVYMDQNASEIKIYYYYYYYSGDNIVLVGHLKRTIWPYNESHKRCSIHGVTAAVRSKLRSTILSNNYGNVPV